MPPRITAAGPADLIAYVWYGLGFRPRESLVAVGLRGPRREAGPVARIDLPTTWAAARAAVRGLLDVLEVDAGCTSCVVLVMTEERPPAAPDDPLPVWAQALDDLDDALAGRGLDLLDVVVVGPAAYRSLRCVGAGCCPPEGFPLDDARSSRVAAALVLEGRTVVDDEQDLVADVDPRTAADRGEPPLVLPPRAPGRVRRQAAYERWCEDLDAGADVPREPDELLAVITADRGARDAVLLALTAAGRPVGLALVRRAGGRVDLEGALFDPPGPQVVRTARRLLAHLARRAPAGRRADVLALLGWLAWAGGDGAQGRLLTERALADRPGHRLALLVADLLAAAVPPPWTRVGRAAGLRG